VLTYDYHQRNATAMQLDACRGINTGLASDVCNNPAGNNTITPTLNSGYGMTWDTGFPYDEVWGPRFPSIRSNVANINMSTWAATADQLQISDATFPAGYAQNWCVACCGAGVMVR
jgi:hypothetical protein